VGHCGRGRGSEARPNDEALKGWRMNTLDALLAGIVADPLEDARWLVLADWLEENDDVRRAELLRIHRRLLATCCEPAAYPERAAWQGRLVELTEQGVRPCVPQMTVTLPDQVNVTFSFIPPGEFLQGTDHEDANLWERPAHRLTLARGFYLAIYPVTQAQWRAIMCTPPSEFTGDARPVENVSWLESQLFCEKMSGLTGAKIRLPKEWEWEYACRAGTTTDYYTGDGRVAFEEDGSGSYTGDGLWTLRRAGWFDNNAGGETHPVGQLVPNGWGLYDMHGNVSEWCDNKLVVYPLTTAENPPTVQDGGNRADRGGSFRSSPRECRSVARYTAVPSTRVDGLGFRVVLLPG
jgi:uncharacterized protein (TIGR02996 family)